MRDIFVVSGVILIFLMSFIWDSMPWTQDSLVKQLLLKFSYFIQNPLLLQILITKYNLMEICHYSTLEIKLTKFIKLT